MGWIGWRLEKNMVGAGVIRGWGGGKTRKAILSRFDRWCLGWLAWKNRVHDF